MFFLAIQHALCKLILQNMQKNVAVNITVGATMWAISLSLIVLAVIEAKSSISHMTYRDALWVIVRLVIFLLSVLSLFPRFARMFFKRYHDPISEFMVVGCVM